MGIATGITSEKMLELANGFLVSGHVDASGNLILANGGGQTTNAGNVRGPQGNPGPIGPVITGLVSLFAGNLAPSGWMICDGSAISRSVYAPLFAAIGTSYGAGDGATTFNLPNLKGRVPVGVDPSQTEFSAVAQTGGEKTHLLTSTEMPSHTHVQNAHGHTMSDPGHVHTQNAHSHGISDPGHGHSQNSHGHTQAGHSHVPNVLDGFEAYQGSVATRRKFQQSTAADGTAGVYYTIAAPALTNLDYATATDVQTPTINSTTASNNGSGTGVSVLSTTATSNSTTTGVTAGNTTATNQSTGGGGAHNNVQPYLAMNYIIKY